MVYVPPAPAVVKATARTVKAPKYKNKKVEFRGEKFDSIGERDRFLMLLQDQEEGKIQGLRRQVTFPLAINGIHICKYIADFTYTKAGVLVVEDFKGVITDTFQLKAKMFKAIHGFDITITKRPAWRSSNTLESGSWKTK